MKRKPTASKLNEEAAQPPIDESWDDLSTTDAQESTNEEDPDEASDLDSYVLVDIDERHWDVFIPDDDDRDQPPDYGDFWMPD